MKLILLLSALAASASAFSQAPVGLARVPSRPSLSVRRAPATVRYGIFGPSKEEIAQREAEEAQDRLNAEWAKQTDNEILAMTGFGIVTGIPIVYLLYVAVSGGGSGAPVL